MNINEDPYIKAGMILYHLKSLVHTGVLSLTLDDRMIKFNWQLKVKVDWFHLQYCFDNTGLAFLEIDPKELANEIYLYWRKSLDEQRRQTATDRQEEVLQRIRPDKLEKET